MAIKRDTPLSATPPPKVQKWYEKPGSMASKLQKYGTPNKPATKSNSSGLGDILDVPQKQTTKMFTGKYETPGQALERKGVVKNIAALDAIDFVADPINFIPTFKVVEGGINLLKGAKKAKAAAKTSNMKAVNKVIKTGKKADNVMDIKESRGTSVLKTGPAGANLTKKPVAKDTTTNKSSMPAKKSGSKKKR